jgi:hypothetical protein
MVTNHFRVSFVNNHRFLIGLSMLGGGLRRRTENGNQLRSLRETVRGFELIFDAPQERASCAGYGHGFRLLVHSGFGMRRNVDLDCRPFDLFWGQLSRFLLRIWD